MSVQYANILKTNSTSEYDSIFNEAVQTVKNSCRVNALGGAAELYSDVRAFNTYVEKLVEGFDARDAECLTNLLNNNRMVVLSESSLGGIPPITALNCPTIVKMWAKSGLKNVVPTQVVDKPVFSVLFNRPYMLDDDGNKVYLPEGLTNESTKKVGNKERIKVTIQAAHANGETVNLAALDNLDEKLKKRLQEEEIDDAVITKVGNKAVKAKMSLERRFFIQIDSPANNVFGQIDLEKRTIILAQTGEAADIEMELGVSSAFHTKSTEISFEVKREDFEIPTGRHFEVNLPLEFINDMYALYKIDSASTATETMSNVINQKLEQELDEFLTTAVNDEEDGRKAEYHREFSVYPDPNYAIQPKDWVEELKRVIDYLAMTIKNKSYFYQGYFVIYGNPVDIALLPNVSWTFNSASDNVNGVNANYSIGAMSGSNKYVIVASDLVDKGFLRMIMVPSVDDYKTFMYYPYTFNIVNNYLNAQGKKTMPNLMMTKRHTMAQFMNLSAKITIKNNDGKIAYQTV